MDAMIDSLKKLGLNETESVIYLQLLKRGSLTAIEISREAKIHRRTIYDNLNILINKGLVTFFIRKEVRYFQANNPDIMKQFQEDRDRILENILPTLNMFYSNKRKDPHVSIFKGLDSTKAILLELMEYKKEVLWTGGGFKLLDSLGYSNEIMLNELAKCRMRIIQPKTKKKDFLKYFSESRIRFVNKKYASEVSFFVYGETVIIGSLLNQEMFVIKIESKDIAQAYKNYFEIMWASAN